MSNVTQKNNKTIRISIGSIALVAIAVFAYNKVTSIASIDDDNTITWSEITTQESLDKENYIINTASIQELQDEIIVTKTGQLMGSSNITISSQVPGRIADIRVDQGNTVGAGQVLITLSDTSGYYNSLERAKLTYQQTEIQLNKAIADSQNALDQATHNYDITSQQLDQQTRQADLQLDQALNSNELSRTSLQNNFFSYYSQYSNWHNNVRDLSDQLFGFSDRYDEEANDRQINLRYGWQEFYYAVKDQYDTLLADRDALQNMSTQPTEQQLQEYVLNIDQWYKIAESHLNDLTTLLQEALTTNKLTATDRDTYIATINGYLQSYYSLYSSFSLYKNQVDNLYNAIDDETSTVDLTQQQAQLLYDTQITQIKDTLYQIELAKKIAQENYDYAIANKKTQLPLLQNSINDAQRNASKLVITTPINAAIDTVLVDKGQEVTIGTPLVSLVGNEQNEIIIKLSENEKNYLTIGQVVTVIAGNYVYQASIQSIAQVADTSLSYPVVVAVQDDINLLWSTVQVELLMNVKGQVIPLSAVDLIGDNQAFVYLYADNSVQQYSVGIKEVWNQYVLLANDLAQTAQVITSDMSQYDSNKHTVTIPGQEKTDPEIVDEDVNVEWNNENNQENNKENNKENNQETTQEDTVE